MPNGDGGASSSTSRSSLDFTRFIDPTPITVHPRLPLETVMEIFKKLGPRCILVEQKGRLLGVVTVKDVLKYQAKVEHGSSPKDDTGELAAQEKIWDFILGVIAFAKSKVRRSALRLSAAEEDRRVTGNAVTRNFEMGDR